MSAAGDALHDVARPASPGCGSGPSRRRGRLGQGGEVAPDARVGGDVGHRRPRADDAARRRRRGWPRRAPRMRLTSTTTSGRIEPSRSRMIRSVPPASGRARRAVPASRATASARRVVDVKGLAELDAGIADTGDGGLRIGARTVMTDITEDPRIRSRLPSAGGWGGRRRLGPDPEPGDAGREHRQRVPGGGHRAGAPRLRGAGGGRRTGRRAEHHRRRVRMHSGVTTLARGELITAIELPRPIGPAGAIHVAGPGGAGTTSPR